MPRRVSQYFLTIPRIEHLVSKTDIYLMFQQEFKSLVVVVEPHIECTNDVENYRWNETGEHIHCYFEVSIDYHTYCDKMSLC